MYEFEVNRYVDTREIDWTDALDPRTSPTRTEHRSEATYAALTHPTMMAIRLCGAYAMAARVVPGGADFTVAPNASFEDKFSVEPGSFLMAISATSSDGQGFRFQVKDLGSGQILFSTPIRSSIFTGPTFLTKPWSLATGDVAVQVINQSPNAAALQVVLFLASPQQEPGMIPNAYDAVLQKETQRSLSTRRAVSGLGAIGDDATDDYKNMPQSGSPFLALKTKPAPAAGSTVVIASFRVPPQTRAAITHMRQYYDGVGFVDGGPELAWTITVDGATIGPGFENLSTTMGRQQWEALAGPLTARAGQLVEYRATAAADLAGTITAGVQGFFYPA